MLARRSNRSNVNRLWDTAFWAMISLALFAFVSLSGPALASSEKTDAKESEEPANAEPEIPETVIVPDPVSLTVLLPKSGAIRQIVFHIWLEAQSREAVPLIEHNLPKIINGFLVDLQRLMYRDTKQRFETRPAGKRSFKYSGPALLPPPPPKTEEELAAEAEAIEAAKEKGEEIVPEPPFSPFAPVTNRYFAALQNKLLRTGQSFLPPDTLRSVQVRMFYDHWPGDAQKR
ncbi:hypothetical protein [Thalassospira povalilytica]|uniref:Uncharacterized protein n=2 Tax=Thalassospiraceae TaxID=2844866 RepID=A0A8I1SIM3_9PROT|nr:hypothetical protein [Thalassospira povalilytica]MBN8195536.1 hypothetical protein [Thalassospira povalilytica]|eukprot:TRINITY_DN571_c0_g9_i2.p1 TRINITY_DN571_c0_g9~~TRINITY_DN571_c0_g9_i2.p1  ORF type:complete len:231 (-),score=37.58 TRINITY_DN571_c0_g9_i2:445-1137(-)